MNNDLRHEYDPIAAHEYYLRVRELKGRKEAEDTTASDKDREWRAAKLMIDKKKALEIGKGGATSSKKDSSEKDSSEKEASSEKKAKKTKELKDRGVAIKDKLAKIAVKEESKVIAARMRIDKEVESKINSLPEIPKNISSAQKAILMADRQAAIAKITKDAEVKYEQVSAELNAIKGINASKSTKKSSEITSTKKKKLTSLKKKVKEAKEKSEEANAKIKAKYEKMYTDEYEKILVKYSER